MLPDEFKKMTEDCDIVSGMLNDLGDEMKEVEMDVVKIMRGRWLVRLSVDLVIRFKNESFG